MQAIITKDIGPTLYRGSRIKATCARGTITVPFDYDLDTMQANHVAAAQALVNKFLQEDFDIRGQLRSDNTWNRPRAAGAAYNGTYAHVFINI